MILLFVGKVKTPEFNFDVMGYGFLSYLVVLVFCKSVLELTILYKNDCCSQVQ